MQRLGLSDELHEMRLQRAEREVEPELGGPRLQLIGHEVTLLLA